ncbi:MAG: hypothetical protein M3Y41_18065, partial [Pseudomonadota bacterium]|nr:hypothetical protein [Pseudomonadota bacterium]
QDPVVRLIVHEIGSLHRRLDHQDRNAADLLMLITTVQELVLDKRRPFSERSKQLICRVTAAEPYEGLCPACNVIPVVTGTPPEAVPGAEFDHFYHRGLNRPEFGWLLCRACHQELTQGGHLARYTRATEFRRFQDKVRDASRAGRIPLRQSQGRTVLDMFDLTPRRDPV